MSLSKIIQKSIDDTILIYINEVANKYNLNKTDLLKMWNNEYIEKFDLIPITKESLSSNKNLSNLTKNELIELCKLKNLKIKGTKAELIDSITKYDNNSKEKVPEKENIIKKLVAKIPTIPIKKNTFGNLEHQETSFVFDKDKKVFGKQNENGNIDQLSKEDINICNKYKFSYHIPDNLDKKSSLKDINIEELEEGDDAEEVEELEEGGEQDNVDEEEDEEEDEDEEELEDVEEEEFEEEFYKD
jgi:hypothetical protein